MNGFLIHRIVVSHLMVQISMKCAAEFVADDERRRHEQALEEALQRQRKFLWAFREYRQVRAVENDDGSQDDITAFENSEG